MDRGATYSMAQQRSIVARFKISPKVCLIAKILFRAIRGFKAFAELLTLRRSSSKSASSRSLIETPHSKGVCHVNPAKGCLDGGATVALPFKLVGSQKSQFPEEVRGKPLCPSTDTALDVHRALSTSVI